MGLRFRHPVGRVNPGMALVIGRNAPHATSEKAQKREIREAIRAQLADASQTSTVTDRLRATVAGYERAYKYSTQTMLDRLHAGSLKETREVVEWTWAWQTLQSLSGTPTTGTM